VVGDVHTLTNCLVNWNAVTWSLNYRANYTYYQFGESIQSLTAVHVGGIGTFKDAGTQIVTPSANSANWAMGEGHATQSITILGMGITRTIGIELWINTRANPPAQEHGFGT
jgi:hypothetical protein